MKLRSLFLASLAAVAMVSCSNEEDVTMNGNVDGEKDAIVQFGISFANPGTRATTVTPGNPTTEKGIAAEQTFVDATIVIEQNGAKNVVTFPVGDFTNKTAEGATSILWLKEKIAVNEGLAKVYVFLNASDALKGSLQSAATSSYGSLKETVDFATGGIDALAATGKIANAGHFLMSNSSGAAVTETFEKGKPNTLTVPVSRVAAKLQEMTPVDNTFNVADNAINLLKKKITVELTDYAYSGLQQETAVLRGGAVTRSLYNAYDSEGAVYDYLAVNGDRSTYCMENLTGATLQTTTNVIYKGAITVEDVPAGTTIYITSDNKFFASIDDMAAAGYNFQGLEDDTTVKECWDRYSLRKYDGGVCYYVAQIKTAANNTTTIVRNNIYRLSVTSIGGIGSVLPETFEDPTLLDLTVSIDPWTVNLNSFEF